MNVSAGSLIAVLCLTNLAQNNLFKIKKKQELFSLLEN